MGENIFINYRRGEDQAAAGRLYDQLESKYRRERIFIDVDGILPADQGSAYAQVFVGMLYQNGQGVGQDPAQALSWYLKAALQGNATAQYDLGWLYEHGSGVAQDLGAAAAWYRKAADQGSEDAKKALSGLSAPPRAK